MTKPDDKMIEGLWAGARRTPPEMPDHLRTAMAAAALDAMPTPAPRSLWQVIGGVWGASGLAAATLAGLWIGIVPLDSSASWADPVAFMTGPSGVSEQDIDLSWGDFGWIVEEG